MKVKLKVKDADVNDVGMGIARLHVNSMKEMKLNVGDAIEVNGKSKAYLMVWPAYNSLDYGFIAIDGSTRRCIKAKIGDIVTISKVDVSLAEKVIMSMASVDEKISLVGGEVYIRNIFKWRPIKVGDEIATEILGSQFNFRVESTEPEGIVFLDNNTEIVISNGSIKTKKNFNITYDDIGGLSKELAMIREIVEMPLLHPEYFDRIGITPPRGVLLHGPPGTGKTLIAKAVATEVDANFVYINGPEIMSKFVGESEKNIREIFENARKNAPSIIFIDEIDSLVSHRGEVDYNDKVVGQILSEMDGVNKDDKVVVIAATNRPNALDPAIRRGGRFDREILIPPPDENGRYEILKIHTRRMPIENLDLKMIASMLHGFVGADIATLCKEAGLHAIRRGKNENVKQEDFDYALSVVKPSAMRDVSINIPNVTWNDIGGLDNIKQVLKETVEWPLKFPEVFKITNTKPPKGILLFGPPGTGKTLIAKAIAHESGANFISIKGPELLSKWVGESEKGIRDIFNKARQNAPSIIFFDEIDALVPSRGSDSSTSVMERVVSQMLAEMDGMNSMDGVVIIASTNRPDMIDAALLRPGRFDKLLYVPPPDEKTRADIIRIHMKGKPLDDSATPESISSMMIDGVYMLDGYVGADIEALCREASMQAIRESINSDMTRDEATNMAKKIKITKKHFLMAAKKVRPSASKESILKYEKIAKEFMRRM